MNAIALWLMFYAGFVINLIRQAATSATSSSNGLNNSWDWLKLHWHVVLVRLFLSSIFAPVAIKFIPANTGLSPLGVYGAAGFVIDNFLDSALFAFGQKIGMKVEVPQVVPPKVNQ